MRDSTVQRFNELLEANIRMLSILKSEIAANTQATGHNTFAVEKITEGLRELAKETGSWRKDDKEHHEGETTLDQEKISKGEEIVKAIDGLAVVLKQK